MSAEFSAHICQRGVMAGRSEQGEREDVDDGCGEGHERGVEAVEHASVSWEDVAAVLDADGALEEALHEVAPRSEDADHQSKSEPLDERENGRVEGRLCGIGSLLVEPIDGAGCDEHEDASSDASLPRFPR